MNASGVSASALRSPCRRRRAGAAISSIWPRRRARRARVHGRVSAAMASRRRAAHLGLADQRLQRRARLATASPRSLGDLPREARASRASSVGASARSASACSACARRARASASFGRRGVPRASCSAERLAAASRFAALAPRSGARGARSTARRAPRAASQRVRSRPRGCGAHRGLRASRLRRAARSATGARPRRPRLRGRRGGSSRPAAAPRPSRRVGGRGEAVPAPQIALARDEPLAGLELCPQGGAVVRASTMPICAQPAGQRSRRLRRHRDSGRTPVGQGGVVVAGAGHRPNGPAPRGRARRRDRRRAPRRAPSRSRVGDA